MLGIQIPDNANNGIVSWKNVIHTLCTKEARNRLAATPEYLIYKPNVYRKYIQS